MVSFLAPSSRVSRLTDAFGVARFDAPSSTYRVEVEMIGRRPGLRDGIVVAPGTSADIEIALEPRALRIHGLEVEADARCHIRPEEGLRVSEVWNEIRTALEAAQWTARGAVYGYQIERHVRDLEFRTGKVLRDERERARGYARAPFKSLPAARLAAEGYVQPAGDGRGSVYYAPDAEVLLSDNFLDTHCMRLLVGRGARDGWVGLAFDPVRDLGHTEIAGTLWLDPASWELRHLDFWYEGLPPDLPSREVGGDISFQRLPDGTWIIPDWTIRMPLLGRSRDIRGRERTHQIGMREERGRLMRLQGPGGKTVLATETGTIDGVVADSTGLDPMRGAVVELLGAGVSTRTGRNGRFTLSELTPGAYQLLLSHPRLSEFEHRPEPVTVRVAAGQVAAVQLRVPSLSELITATCASERGDEPEGSSSPVTGRILDPATELPLPGSVVEVAWGEESLRVEAGYGGRYHLCGLPGSVRLTMAPSWGGHTGTQSPIVLPDDGRPVVHDLTVPVQGYSRISGRVRESSTDLPVESATVALKGDGQTVREVRTDEQGRFDFGRVPAGAHRLSVQHAAYQGGTDGLGTRPGEHVELAVELKRIPAEVRRLLPRLATIANGVVVEVVDRAFGDPPG
jgi:hypothetical protein